MIIHCTDEEHDLLKHTFDTDKVNGRHLVAVVRALEEIMKKAVDPHETDDAKPDDMSPYDDDWCAWQIMKKVKPSEPGQFSIIEDTIRTRGITAWQYLVGLLLRCGEMFELGNPREVRDYVETNDVLEMPHAACPSCSKDFKMVRMGQVYCSNSCGCSL